MTNDRLLDEAGDLQLVASGDRLVGPGSSPVMAAFTHRGFRSRFTNGDFGVYYAADSLETAIAETIYYKERGMKAANESNRLLYNSVRRPGYECLAAFRPIALCAPAQSDGLAVAEEALSALAGQRRILKTRLSFFVQPTLDILMEDAGNQCLVGDTFC
ncbi:RES family NAD+ phosphorylase [Marinobacter sp. LV10R510-11A]|uniref:RES family NAD+ phosphorylase n=1 Tax=Marinobacter sp. LV10R510-11A TaxID=1415568 RepID=UPI0026BEF79E